MEQGNSPAGSAPSSTGWFSWLRWFNWSAQLVCFPSSSSPQVQEMIRESQQSRPALISVVSAEAGEVASTEVIEAELRKKIADLNEQLEDVNGDYEALESQYNTMQRTKDAEIERLREENGEGAESRLAVIGSVFSDLETEIETYARTHGERATPIKQALGILKARYTSTVEHVSPKRTRTVSHTTHEVLVLARRTTTTTTTSQLDGDCDNRDGPVVEEVIGDEANLSTNLQPRRITFGD